MAFIITEPCIGTCDTACLEVCPVDCIQPADGYCKDEDITNRQLFIDPEACIDCYACVPECPVEAIYEESEVPEQWQQYIAINAEHFADGGGY